MHRQWYHTSGPSCVLELDVACVSTFGFVSGKVPISKPKPCIDHLQIFMALGPSANVFLCTKGWFPIWLAFDVLSLIDLDELKLLFIRTCPLFKIEKVLKCSNNVNSSACLSNIFCWWKPKRHELLPICHFTTLPAAKLNSSDSNLLEM